MFHANAARFDLTENLENFLDFEGKSNAPGVAALSALCCLPVTATRMVRLRQAGSWNGTCAETALPPVYAFVRASVQSARREKRPRVWLLRRLPRARFVSASRGMSARVSWHAGRQLYRFVVLGGWCLGGRGRGWNRFFLPRLLRIRPPPPIEGLV